MNKKIALFLVLALSSFTGAASASTITYDFESGAQGWTVGGDASTSLGYGSIAPTWALGASLPGFVGQALPSMWWANPNNGDMGAERSYLVSPLLIAADTTLSINFDSFSSNEGGYPIFYDVEHIQISVNGGLFSDVHAFDSLLHNSPDQIFRNLTYVTMGITVGDQIRYRFLYDTGDNCCGPSNITGWAFDNVTISGIPEPGTLALVGLGLVGLGLRRRKRA